MINNLSDEELKKEFKLAYEKRREFKHNILRKFMIQYIEETGHICKFMIKNIPKPIIERKTSLLITDYKTIEEIHNADLPKKHKNRLYKKFLERK